MDKGDYDVYADSDDEEEENYYSTVDKNSGESKKEKTRSIGENPNKKFNKHKILGVCFSFAFFLTLLTLVCYFSLTPVKEGFEDNLNDSVHSLNNTSTNNFERRIAKSLSFATTTTTLATTPTTVPDNLRIQKIANSLTPSSTDVVFISTV